MLRAGGILNIFYEKWYGHGRTGHCGSDARDSNNSWCSFLVCNIIRSMPQVYLFFLIICNFTFLSSPRSIDRYRSTVHVAYTVTMADEVELESAVRGFQACISCMYSEYKAVQAATVKQPQTASKRKGVYIRRGGSRGFGTNPPSKGRIQGGGSMDTPLGLPR